MQLTDLTEAQRSGQKRVDTLERATTNASKTSQQYEAQVQGLQRQLKESQAATRLAQAELDKVCPCLLFLLSCPSAPVALSLIHI